MACASLYVDMMSLKLDGLLDGEDERLLQIHIVDCLECAVLWSGMQEADSLLLASVKAPVPVPATLHRGVMLKIAATPRSQGSVLAMPGFGHFAPSLVPSFVPSVGGAAYDLNLPFGSNETLREMQAALSHVLRGAAAVGLSIAGTAGLMIGLMVSGVLQVGGPFAEAVAMLRTFFGAVLTWLGSIAAGVGSGAVAGLALVMALMLLVAWQVVAAYHRTATVEGSHAGLAEALG